MRGCAVRDMTPQRAAHARIGRGRAAKSAQDLHGACRFLRLEPLDDRSL